jgi:hypothetical protein
MTSALTAALWTRVVREHEGSLSAVFRSDMLPPICVGRLAMNQRSANTRGVA